MSTRQRLSHIARLFKVAGDESRLKILCVIFEHRGVCVSDIAASLHMSVAIVSHHLQVMTRSGLLKCNRKGKCAFYVFVEHNLAADLKKIICRYK